MRNKALLAIVGVALVIGACTRKNGYEAKPSDMDGTWVSNVKYLSGSGIHEREYVWGKGKRIVEVSLEIEMEKNSVLIPGQGEYIIDTIIQEDPDIISMEIYGVEDPEQEYKKNMKFHFESYDKFWIECPQYEGERGVFSVGRDRPWYRLSGPEGKGLPSSGTE
jgi:hypothetical protein